MANGSRIDVIDLIEKTRNGDRKAEIKLYNYYKRKLEYFLKKKYPKNKDFEDDVSEIAAKIFEKLSTYDREKSQFNTWVINIANNYMIDKNRKKKLIYTCETEHGIMTTTSNPDDPYTFLTLDYETLSIPDACRPDIQLELNDSITYYCSNANTNAFNMVDMKSKGYNYSEIGCEFNLSESQVSNKINYFTSVMKKRGE